MLHLKTTNEPVVVEALNRVKKGHNKHTSKITGSYSLYEILKKINFGELQNF